MNALECPRPGRVRGPLFVLLSILLLTVAFTACSNPEKAKAEHVRRGEQYLKDKKFQEAALEFRNAIQLDDRLGAAHWGLAQAYEGQENYLAAIQELTRTTQLDPNNLDAAVRLGNYYIVAYQGKHDDQLKKLARDLADTVLQKDPNHIEGHILRATVLYADGKKPEALAELKRAVELNPQRMESLMSLARFYAQEGDNANAEATYQHALQLNDRSALAHMQYGIYQAQQRRPEQAEAEFRKAVEVEPENREARRTLASYYLASKQTDKAEQVFKDLAELDKDRPEGRAVLGDFYSAVGRYDDATRVYQDLIAQAPDYTQARYRLGEIMLQRGDLKGAEQQAQTVLDKNALDMSALKLRARVRLQRGDARPAAEDLAQVLKQEGRDQAALYFMAQAQLTLGQIEQARSYVGDLNKYFPDYLPGKLMQAQINLRAGGDENMRSTVRLASELLDQLAQTTPSAALSPELLQELRVKAYTARGAANLQLRNAAAARADFTAARDLAPNTPSVYVNLAGVAISEKKPAEAEQLYERALQVDSGNFDALNGLISLYLPQGQYDRAFQRADQALAAQPDSAGLHFLKAQIYGAQAGAAMLRRDTAQQQAGQQGAEAELRRALELDPNYSAALASLAALYMNSNDPQRAIDEYRKVTERPPDTDDAAAFTLIGMVEDRRGNADAAVEAYKQALQRNPNQPIAGNNLAWMYAEFGKGNLDEAVRIAQGVVQQNPDEPGYADTLGWVYYKKGLYAAAVEQLQKAADKAAARGGDSPLYRYHLGLALAKMSRRPEARQQLQQALTLGATHGLSPQQLDDARQTLATL